MEYALILLRLLLLLALIQPIARAAEPTVPDDELGSFRKLTDAGFRGEAAGIEVARKPFETAPSNETPAHAARRQYLLALADWQLSLALGADATRSLEAGRRADVNVKAALALDPDLVPAYILRNWVVYLLFQKGALTREEAVAARTETYKQAAKVAPDDPLVMMMGGMNGYYAPGADRAKVRARIREAIDRLAAMAPSDPHAAMWLALAWNVYGTMLLGEGDADAAKAAFEATLKVRPDYAFVKTALLPMTEPVDGGPAPQLASDGWQELITDPTGDGRFPGFPDLTSVSWRVESDGEVWFRLTLAAPIDPSKLGVNLALDIDGDPKNGSSWWAGNTEFRYDRLVTVWVARGTDGRYRGTLGLAGAADAAAGRYVTPSLGRVRFAVEPSNRVIFVGVSRKSLGGDRLGVVATVGSNTGWNDVAPATGSALLQLKR
jgi:tetratricopeptide (TPR) repeat protein